VVAVGSRLPGVGVRIRIIGPAHRHVPAIAGLTVTKGAVSSSDTRPTATIGSEKRMRISDACSRLATSPVGPALTTVSDVCAIDVTLNSRHRRTACTARPIDGLAIM
jgi:hypothetical protein